MARGSLIAIALAVLASGCLAQAAPFATRPDDAVALTGFYAGPALWPDPQNAPHPAWNWPTLSNPTLASGAPAWWAPLPAADLPDAVAGMDLVARSPGNIRGAGIAVFGSLVVAPGFSADTHLVSLADPTHPVVLSTIEGRHRGAAVIAYPDGRLVAVFATSNDLEFYDITDPAMPEFLAERTPRGGSHKVGVVPGTPIVYNANSDGSNSQMEIYDLTDPANPVLVKNFSDVGCHHVYFWITPEKQRSICAGIEVTRIMDIADPRNPVTIVDVPVHHGVTALPSYAVLPATFSHFAILSQDGDTLIVGDETGGGSAPACDVHVQAAGVVSASGPLGNLYFYDITDETDPVLQGWFNPGSHLLVQPTNLPGSCTAHHGRLVPDPAGERDLLVMGFYSAGTVLIDFTDPHFPQLVAQHPRGTTWEAWYANGWIVTGDLARGVDVLRLV